MSEILDITLMTQFDILVLVFLSLSSLFAFFKGFMKSAISFAGLLFIAFLSFNLSFLFAPLIEKFLISHSWSVVVMASILFVIFLVVMSFISSVVFIIVSPLCGGIIDRFMGILLGFARGCIILSFIFYIITIATPSLDVRDKSDVFYDNKALPTWAKNAESLMLLARGARIVSEFIPQNFNKVLRSAILESRDSKGNFDMPSDRIEDIHSLNKVFSLLPSEVLEEMSQKDLITLQDHSAEPYKKVRILEDMANKYQRYINDKASYGAEDIKRINKKYHDVVSSLNEEISRYNSLIN